MHQYSFTNLHRLSNTPTRFGARRHRPQGASSSPLDFPTHQVAVNTCPPYIAVNTCPPYIAEHVGPVVPYLAVLIRLLATVSVCPSVIICTPRLASTSAESRQSVI